MGPPGRTDGEMCELGTGVELRHYFGVYGTYTHSLACGRQQTTFPSDSRTLVGGKPTTSLGGGPGGCLHVAR